MVENRLFEIIASSDNGITVENAAANLFSFSSGSPEAMYNAISSFIEKDDRFYLTERNQLKLTKTGFRFKGLMEKTFVVVDLETTGTRTYKDKITEIAAFKVRGGEIIDRYESLVNPGRYIPYNITRITGITNEMVQNAPLIEELMPVFLEFLGNAVFVAHNAAFDSRFIKAALDEMGIDDFNNSVLCTVKLSRKVFPGFKGYDLGTVSKGLGINILSRHRAGGDAEATAKVLIKILYSLPGSNIFGIEELIN